MATIYWRGDATAVAQVSTVTFGTYDATTTRTITVGNRTISAADSGGNLTAALTALAVLLNASTHPYFSGVTWSSNATQIIGTADTAGVEFTFSGSVSGGTGTVSASGVMANTTANAGPSDWSTASNWSGGAVPVNGDTVIIKDNSVNICFGLGQSAVTLAKLTIEKTYSGKIGNDRTVFVTGVNGATVSTAIEYRNTYLAISATLLDIGEYYGTGTATGSSRIMIDTGSNASTTTIYETASSSADTGRPSIRLKFAHASSNLYVRSAVSGVGVGVDTPNETTSLALISITDTSSNSRVFTGGACTLTTWSQQGGNNSLHTSATPVGTVNIQGGALLSEGVFAITLANMSAGTWTNNNANGAGLSASTIRHSGGTLDLLNSRATRTITNLNLGDFNGFSNGSPGNETIELLRDAAYVIVTNFAAPGVPCRLTIDAA